MSNSSIFNVIAISEGNKTEFERLFREYYPILVLYARKYIFDSDTAEEIVQNVFVGLWEKRSDLQVLRSVEAYLYRSVANASLNYIKHRKVVLGYAQKKLSDANISDDSAFELISANELQLKINDAVGKLPPKRKQIFEMSRYEGLKYKEIADKLSISPKTVEVQISQALKFMRKELGEYLPYVLLLVDLL